MARDGQVDRTVVGILSLHEGRPVAEHDIHVALLQSEKDASRMIPALRSLQHRGLVVKVIDDAGTSWMLPRGGLDVALSMLRGD